MAFEALGLLVLFHVLFAALWFGGVLFMVTMVGPAMAQAGPAGGGFVMTVMRRGGMGKYFATTGALTLAFGAILYGIMMQDGSIETFSGAGLWLTLGAIMAVATYAHGLASNMPIEKKLIKLVEGIKGAPTAEQGKQMAELGQKMGKAGVTAAIMLGTAMLLMLLSNVFV
jgi:uncharacterized membrane protein